MKENSGIASPCLTSLDEEGELLASWSRHFAPGMHYLGGWMGPRAGLDAVKKSPPPPALAKFMYGTQEEARNVSGISGTYTST